MAEVFRQKTMQLAAVLERDEAHDAARQALRGFLEAYEPKIARLYTAARKAVLDAAPDANELIYDAYNAVTTAYSFR